MNRHILLLLLFSLLGCQDSSSPGVVSDTDTTTKAILSTLGLDSSSKSEAKKLTDTSTSSVIKDLYVVNSSIIYNDDFEPILTVEVKNNLEKAVIAFELEINPQSYCDIPSIRKKARLLPGKSLLLRQKIKIPAGCSINTEKIYIGDYVLSDGSKRDPGDLYLQRRETWKK